MRISRFLLVSFLVAGCSPILGDEPDVESDLERAFRDYTLVEIDDATIADIAASGRLDLPLSSSTMSLMVVPNDLRSARYQAFATDAKDTRELVMPDVALYKGTIAGDPSTQVRFSVSKDGEIAGTFAFGAQRFYMEPVARYSEGADKRTLVVYKPEALVDSTVATLDGDGTEAAQMQSGLGFASEEVANAAPGSKIIELATDADYELVTARGSATAANAEILQVMNMVEGVYEAELNITFDIVLQHAWTVDDGYDTSTQLALLQSFRARWESMFPRSQYNRDLAHLFAANGSQTGGRGYLNVVCQTPSFGYAVSGVWDDLHIRALVAAHEIGHNVGADHRGNYQPAGDACDATIMNATVAYTTPLTFCPASRQDLQNAVAAHGSCLSEVPPGPMPSGPRTKFDFTGDGRADISVFRPSNGVWYVLQPDGNFSGTQFGQSGDRVAAADYDGDSKTDYAVYRDGTWYRQRSMAGFDVVNWGLASDRPVPADYDGDGRADLAIYRPDAGQWWVMKSSDGSYYAISWGISEDIPTPGDFDGDGKADYAVFRPSTGVWYVMSSSTYAFTSASWGVTGDIPLAADFDGDMRADYAVYRPSNFTWYWIASSNGSLNVRQFGAAGDVPVPADYNGNGRADYAVFRPSTNEWYLADEAYTVTAFGTAGDIAVPGPQ
jgi:hypothetical protein